MMDTDIGWIIEGLQKRGKTQKGLAEALGRAPSAVTELLKSRRRLQLGEIEKIANYLEVDPPQKLTRRTVPIIGHVAAGASLVFDAQSQFLDEADAPDGSTESTVAVEVFGESLGPIFNRWLVFYDDVHSPVTPDQIGKLCVVGVRGGGAVVKKLMRGQLPGKYNLVSNLDPPMYDIDVEWAARVRAMVPR